MKTYFEDFDNGPGGWHTWLGNHAGPGALRIADRIADSVVTCTSPWWVDYNHALPGAGYLHLMMGLRVQHNALLKQADEVRAVAGDNRFIDGRFSTDFRNARFALRLRGDMKMRGARLHLLVQSRPAKHWVNHVLTAQPFRVTPDWSEQEVTLTPDPSQWLCLGSRHDRTDYYGSGPIDDVLRDLNGNLILVLFPLNVAPQHDIADDYHELRAGEDYEVRHDLLPEGSLMFDWVRITLNSNAPDKGSHPK